jgi:prolyl 4-hydroxylase
MRRGAARKSAAVSTTPQAITEELRRWIVAQAEVGCHPDDVLQAMRASGWQESVAIEAMETTLRQRLVELGKPLPPEALAVEPAGAGPVGLPAKALPGPRLQGAPVLLDALDRRVPVLMSLVHPRVVLFGGLLADDECEALITLARPRLARSETVDTATGGSEVNSSRTSDGMFFERGEAPVIARIEQRIARLLEWPVDHGEGLQILRYGPGAEYKPHHDYFDPAQPGTPTILRRGGQRVGTLVIYLNTPTAGGATVFPEAGVEVAPIRGNAVFFSYDRAHASTRTLHGGAPVVEGEKWVATKWLREGVFA